MAPLASQRTQPLKQCAVLLPGRHVGERRRVTDLLKGLALHLQGGLRFENALFDESMIDLPGMDDPNGRRENDHQILCVAKQRQRTVPQRFKRSTLHNNLLTTIPVMCSSTYGVFREISDMDDAVLRTKKGRVRTNFRKPENQVEFTLKRRFPWVRSASMIDAYRGVLLEVAN